MKSKLKLLCKILAILAILYSIIWFKIASSIEDSINKNLASSIQHIAPSHRISFSNARLSGFPFLIGIKLYDVVEDTSSALINHHSPVFFGYNMFTDKLVLSYSGKSTIETKPKKDAQVFESDGNFLYSAHIPVSFDMFKKATQPSGIMDILSNLREIRLQVKNAGLKNSTENIDLNKGSNIDLSIKILHHKKYNNIDDFLSDIPKDYNIDFSLDSRHLANKKISIGYSFIYGAYLPLNLNYTMQANIHTNSKTFDMLEIVKDIQVTHWESNIATDIEESSMKASGKLSSVDDDTNISFNNVSAIKLKPSYSKTLDYRIKNLVNMVPQSVLGPLKTSLLSLDVASLDLDTQNDPITINTKLNFGSSGKTHSFLLNLEHFGISFRDIEFGIRNNTKLVSQHEWSSEGVISAQKYDLLIKYIVDTYFTLYHLPEHDVFNKKFYYDVYMEFISKISNNITNAGSGITIEYDLHTDIPKSKIGKLSWPETGLLYYATLLKHIRKTAKDENETISKFKTIVPDYILNPDSLDKIIIQSKE